MHTFGSKRGAITQGVENGHNPSRLFEIITKSQSPSLHPFCKFSVCWKYNCRPPTHTHPMNSSFHLVDPFFLTRGWCVSSVAGVLVFYLKPTKRFCLLLCAELLDCNGCCLVTEESGEKLLQAKFIEHLTTVTEVLKSRWRKKVFRCCFLTLACCVLSLKVVSHVMVLTGCCWRLLKPCQQAMAKKGKKKKGAGPAKEATSVGVTKCVAVKDFRSAFQKVSAQPCGRFRAVWFAGRNFQKLQRTRVRLAWGVWTAQSVDWRHRASTTQHGHRTTSNWQPIPGTTCFTPARYQPQHWYCFYCDWLTEARAGGWKEISLYPTPFVKFQCRENSLHPPPHPCMEISLQGLEGNFPPRGLEGNFSAGKFHCLEMSLQRKFPCTPPPLRIELSVEGNFLALKFSLQGNFNAGDQGGERLIFYLKV